MSREEAMSTTMRSYPTVREIDEIINMVIQWIMNNWRRLACVDNINCIRVRWRHIMNSIPELKEFINKYGKKYGPVISRQVCEILRSMGYSVKRMSKMRTFEICRP